MNRFPCILCAGVLSCSCSPSTLMTVSVSENAGLDRKSETIELDMADLTDLSAKALPGKIDIRDDSGLSVPFQVYEEYDGRNTLVFQADVAAFGQTDYHVVRSRTASRPDTLAYGRHVPERKDDYAYENDVVAGRIYGPALKKPRTMGPDIWTKNTSRLVINERFARGKYHMNYGDGMDCYKVGKTLGGGALVPLSEDGGIVLGDNWRECVHITDGPVRTKARFIHGPFLVNGSTVSVMRELTLDTGSHFVLWTSEFSCDDSRDSIDVALAAVMHDPYRVDTGEGWVAFSEPASDSKHPEIDGDIFIAVVLEPGVKSCGFCNIHNHAAICARVAPDCHVKSWTGSGWSLAGNIENDRQWREMTESFARRIAFPLTVKINKK